MSDYPARPEWFLMPLYQLRKFFHGPMEFYGTTLLPGASGLFLALVPWIDRPPRSRLAVTVPVAVIFGVAIGMGVAATVHDGRDPHYVKARARADGLAADVAKLAMGGVAPSGPLETMRRDPELRGRDLYERHCASCHVLGDLGDAKKSTASRLDGWGTTAWIEAMMHEPDADHFFGRGPFKGEMPSVDVRPRNIAPTAPWSPSIKSPAELHATAVFLSAQGDEPDDPPHPKVDAATRALGEKIVKERCTECHLLKGDGDDDGTGIAPELIGYGSLAWTREQIANPSSFKTYRSKALAPELKRHMPRFDSDLSPVDVEMVARWTRLHARATSFK
jgi:ubiquinol-cytochrome c reductase cytochrome b subunit